MRKTFLAAAFLHLAAVSTTALADRNTLWRIIDSTCVPAAAAGAVQLPPPCARVAQPDDRKHGWALMKDRRGVLQYLLLPTTRMSGVESPALLEADTPNFFAQAWAARDLLDRLRGQPLPRDTVSLSLNPIPRRSQDQLHVHISCVRPELRAHLSAVEAEIPTQWAPMRGGWLNHSWLVKRVDGETLDGVNLVADVAAHVPDAAADMGLVGISVVGMSFKDGKPGFVLMATRYNANDRTSGSAEHDVQDHVCAVLDGKQVSGDPVQSATDD